MHREHPLKIKWIVFSANSFTTVNHSHCADVCVTVARLAATVFHFPVFKVHALHRVVLIIKEIVSFLVFIHGDLQTMADPSQDGSTDKMKEKAVSLSTP
jgi:hypothetical protein